MGQRLRERLRGALEMQSRDEVELSCDARGEIDSPSARHVSAHEEAVKIFSGTTSRGVVMHVAGDERCGRDCVEESEIGRELRRHASAATCGRRRRARPFASVCPDRCVMG